MIPKEPRTEDQRYLAYVRTRPCTIKGNGCYGPSIPHHTISRGAWGSDHRAIPLCSIHHTETHSRGLKWMEEHYCFNHLDEIIKLLDEYLRDDEPK
jgi:hypothetical protein